jgi:hypothetical protein
VLNAEPRSDRGTAVSTMSTASSIGSCSYRAVSHHTWSACPGLPNAGRELVHDPRLHAHELRLGLLRQQRELVERALAAGERAPRGRGRDLERRGRAEPGAGRHVAPHRHVAGRHDGAGAVERPRDAGEVVPPRAHALERPLEAPARPLGRRRGAPLGRAVGAHRHHGAAVDGDRQHLAAVVVGVLADEVHAPGAGRDHGGVPAERVGEGLAGGGESKVFGHRGRAREWGAA